MLIIHFNQSKRKKRKRFPNNDYLIYQAKGIIRVLRTSVAVQAFSSLMHHKTIVLILSITNRICKMFKPWENSRLQLKFCFCFGWKMEVILLSQSLEIWKRRRDKSNERCITDKILHWSEIKIKPTNLSLIDLYDLYLAIWRQCKLIVLVARCFKYQ